MRPLSDRNFRPELPLQTIDGTKQGLRVGRTTTFELIKARELDVVDLNGATRVTTQSIFRLIERRRRTKETA